FGFSSAVIPEMAGSSGVLLQSSSGIAREGA
uniref:Uncharacterized protein n=1 Tax=Aegilops tauschii subsp. strangulata TaxID=200361 RepID=A0A453R5J8_AEGTS